MTRDEIRDLVAYSEWATTKLADAMAALPDATRRRHDGSAFGSMLGTFSHLVAAEWIWLERWRGTSPPGAPDWVGMEGFAEVRARFEALRADRWRYLEALSDADLARPMAYRTFAGAEGRNVIGDMVRHVVNHGTYHRGQLSMTIRQAGGQPPGTDYIVWLRMPDADRAPRR